MVAFVNNMPWMQACDGGKSYWSVFACSMSVTLHGQTITNNLTCIKGQFRDQWFAKAGVSLVVLL